MVMKLEIRLRSLEGQAVRNATDYHHRPRVVVTVVFKGENEKRSKQQQQQKTHVVFLCLGLHFHLILISGRC